MTFYKDDIVEIISEANPDWWTGKVNGRTGLFPSNYVEKLVHPVPPALANLNSSSPSNPQPVVVHVHTQNDAGPQHAPSPYRGTQPPVQVQHEGEKKEGKYTQLKSTMAHSAAGGLGFGAGMSCFMSCLPLLLLLLSASVSRDSVLTTDRWVGNRRSDRRWPRPRHLLVWIHRPLPRRPGPLWHTWKSTPVCSSRWYFTYMSQVIELFVSSSY